MPDRERTERVRQQLMRLNELLGQMAGRLRAGEQAYVELFSNLPSDETAGLNHKEVQGKLAEQLEDLTPLADVVGSLRFGARELERAFAELHGIILQTAASED